MLYVVLLCKERVEVNVSLMLSYFRFCDELIRAEGCMWGRRDTWQGWTHVNWCYLNLDSWHSCVSLQLTWARSTDHQCWGWTGTGEHIVTDWSSDVPCDANNEQSYCWEYAGVWEWAPAREKSVGRGQFVNPGIPGNKAGLSLDTFTSPVSVKIQQLQSSLVILISEVF